MWEKAVLKTEYNFIHRALFYGVYQNSKGRFLAALRRALAAQHIDRIDQRAARLVRRSVGIPCGRDFAGDGVVQILRRDLSAAVP